MKVGKNVAWTDQSEKNGAPDGSSAEIFALRLKEIKTSYGGRIWQYKLYIYKWIKRVTPLCAQSG